MFCFLQQQILLLMLQCNILISLDKDRSILFLSACPKLDIGMYNKEIVPFSYVQYPLPPHWIWYVPLLLQCQSNKKPFWLAHHSPTQACNVILCSQSQKILEYKQISKAQYWDVHENQNCALLIWQMAILDPRNSSQREGKVKFTRSLMQVHPKISG